MACDLAAHGGDPAAIESVSIDVSLAFIKGVGEHHTHVRHRTDRAKGCLMRTGRLSMIFKPGCWPSRLEKTARIPRACESDP
jgi:hypothetical protein